MRTETYRFLGVDLAWAADRRHSAVAVMEGNSSGVRLTELSEGLFALSAVEEFVLSRATKNCMAAFDAPLIVENATGQRPCESLIGRAFGHFGASCHSSNRKRPYWNTGVRLARRLARAGFAHGLPHHRSRQRPGRWLIEVYPHPAMIRLFELDRILRYKKGSVTQRRAGLRELQDQLAMLASRGIGLCSTPTLTTLLDVDPKVLRGSLLKYHEDRLDAVFCAFVAWHCWRWGGAKNDVFGDLKAGYILVPAESQTAKFCEACS